MAQPTVAAYGTWESPITADLIVAQTIGLGQIVRDGDDIYWSEMRPQEKGRYVVVRRTGDGQTVDVNPPPFNARTRVHEYGGGSYSVHGGTLYFTNFADQRLYCLSEEGEAALLHPGANEFEVAGRFRLVPERKSDAWTHPVIAHGRLYLRYHETLFCYNVRAK